MNTKYYFALFILALFVLWGVFSWRWYTCGVKGFCGDEIAKTEFAPKPATKPEPKKPVFEEKCAPIIVSDIRIGAKNDPRQVANLEKFLRNFVGENLTIDGIYSGTDYAAVKRFQAHYFDEILRPINAKYPTGLVLSQTRAKINSLVCGIKY